MSPSTFSTPLSVPYYHVSFPRARCRPAAAAIAFCDRQTTACTAPGTRLTDHQLRAGHWPRLGCRA